MQSWFTLSLEIYEIDIAVKCKGIVFNYFTNPPGISVSLLSPAVPTMLSSRVLLLVPLVAVTVEACSSTKKNVEPVAEPETNPEPATASTLI